MDDDNDAPLDFSGSMEVMPIETTKYSFYAKKGRKTYSKTTKITVLKPEIISFGGSSVVRENKEGYLEGRQETAVIFRSKVSQTAFLPAGASASPLLSQRVTD